MANLTDRLAGLSPEKRELVEAPVRQARDTGARDPVLGRTPRARRACLAPEKRELGEALLRKKREQAEGTTSIPRRARPGDPPPTSFSQERLGPSDEPAPG